MLKVGSRLRLARTPFDADSKPDPGEEQAMNRNTSTSFRARVARAALLGIAALALGIAPRARAAEVLPGWNDGPAKARIVQFVESVTDPTSREFVPPAERIAVFDNDGTLWSEQPMYFQLAFILDRVKALAPQHPEWKTTEPFKSVLGGDMAAVAASGERGLLQLMAATHAGMTSEEFSEPTASRPTSCRGEAPSSCACSPNASTACRRSR
jgi:hypothetical protein